MLEILAVFWLTNKIGKVVEDKGHKSGKYKWMAVGLWFGGEIAGGIFGTIIGLFLSDGGEGFQCIAYIFALIGAITGAVIANMIANNLQPVEASPSTNDPLNTPPN